MSEYKQKPFTKEITEQMRLVDELQLLMGQFDVIICQQLTRGGHVIKHQHIILT